MRRGKKDANHDAIVAAFERLGCSVLETIDTGLPGFPDLIVGAVGVSHLVECKNLDTAYGRVGLSPNQSALARDWRGSPIHVVATEDHVIDLVTGWRRAKRSA